MKNKEGTSITVFGGTGFIGLLQLLFIAFKLADIIDWEWIWVLAPAWIVIGFVIFVLMMVFTIWMLAICFGKL